jgi:hypothetical protein
VNDPSDDRRRFPRIPLLSEAWIIDGDERRHCRTRDLSEGGVCVEGDAGEWEIGKVVELELGLPQAPEPMKTAARVQWKREGMFGVEFTDLDEGDRGMILRTVTRILEELRSLEDEKTPT